MHGFQWLGNEEMILRYIDLHGGEIDESMHFGVLCMVFNEEILRIPKASRGRKLNVS